MSDWRSFRDTPPGQDETRIDVVIDTPTGLQRTCDLVRNAGKWSIFSFARDEFVNLEDPTSKRSGILFWAPVPELPDANPG